jgi:demethylmenaquinone methyltransferase/2-methoxy-6-polyprenyl-1,4-benzoquinol methylase
MRRSQAKTGATEGHDVMGKPAPAMRTPSTPGRRAESAFDATAPRFDRHRALPEGVPQAIRAAVLAATGVPSPRLLDLGAGTGRIGRPFVAAGDDYVGIDLSLGMLREFAGHVAPPPPLAQADGERLPFGDSMFDAVLMVQVFGGMRGWRRVLAEARRLLRPRGVLLIGRVVAPADGLDTRLKQRLVALLAERHVAIDRKNVRDDVERSLAGTATRRTVTVATWTAERTPRRYLDRQRTSARLAALPAAVAEDVLATLADWAISTFGGLDAAIREPHAFELQTFTFAAMDSLHA